MSVVISEIGGIGIDFPPDVITHSAEFLQQEKAKAGYEAAKERWDKVIPANPNAPAGPLPPPVTGRGEIDAFFARPQVPARAASLPSAEAPGRERSVPTWAWVAGGAAALLVTYMMLRPTRGIERTAPATAGLGGTRRRRRRRR